MPIPVTALTPLIVFLLTAMTDLSGLSSSYANTIIFLFLGGFVLALALGRWNLHRRIALFVGTSAIRLVAGFMIATAFLSRWASNTPTAMMIPMGMSLTTLVIKRRKNLQTHSNFSVALMLGIAYAATCGVFGTMIGNPVNVTIVGYIRQTPSVDVTFLQWMLVGVPLMIVKLIVGWLVLTKIAWRPEIDKLPGGRELFLDHLAEAGPMPREEKLTLTVVGLAAAWRCRVRSWLPDCWSGSGPRWAVSTSYHSG